MARFPLHLCSFEGRWQPHDGLTTAGRQGLPQHVSQKANQDVGADAMFAVVPHGSDL
jgi:hypothetical protein